MHKPPMSNACCRQYNVLPECVDCFTPGICKELQKLECRYNQVVTKRKRLWELSVPKHCTDPYVPVCACIYQRPINIVRLEQPVRTRTEQLAYPTVRRLLLFKMEKKHLFDNLRLSILNRLTRKSLFSMYSRLANAEAPIEPVPKHKWDKKEWATHRKHFKQLAKHKQLPPIPKVKRETRPLKTMKRFKYLAIPKYRELLEKEEWKYTAELKNYSATERIKELAKPKFRDEGQLIQELPIRPTENALRYKASPRILEISGPLERRAGESDLKDNPFAIAPNALKAKASARTQELAEPKEYENKHIREDPTLISPAALKAVARPRTIELAKPKGS